MHVVIHGGMTFSQKSHAHIQRGIALGLKKLGHEVTICRPIDPNNFDPNNPYHVDLRQMCTDDHIYSDYNIWKTSLLNEFKRGRHRFDCLVHNDGHYRLDPQTFARFRQAPFNYYLRSGLDASVTISEQIGKPVYAFYDGSIDEMIFHPQVEPYNYRVGDKFVFLVVSQTIWPADLRGTDLAVKAFLEEFSPGEDVILFLKIAENHRILHELAATNQHLIYMPGLATQNEMARFYKGADCLLSPIRGAMWEAPVMEAMASGTPAIATDAGGPGMFISDNENGFLLDYRWASYDRGDRKGNCYPGEIWKEPDFQQLKSRMREAFEKRQELPKMGKRASKHILNMFTNVAMARKLIEFFKGSTEFLFEWHGKVTKTTPDTLPMLKDYRIKLC